MNTPFDDALAAIQAAKYHNHRLETHSDTVSQGIIRDLARICAPLADDLDTGRVKIWPNVSAPGDRQRKVDLFVGEPTALGQPDVRTCRIAVENKSVITAHRNRTNRFDDLKKVLGAIHSVRPEALLVATVLVGLAERVLNVPDRLRPLFSGTDQEFDDVILPRLCVGDERLWSEFPRAVSRNSSTDPAKTVELFRTLPTRKPGLTHIEGYDFVLLVPVYIDNVNPPSLPRPNRLGIDVDSDYQQMLEQMCAAYKARWHT